MTILAWRYECGLLSDSWRSHSTSAYLLFAVSREALESKKSKIHETRRKSSAIGRHCLGSPFSVVAITSRRKRKKEREREREREKRSLSFPCSLRGVDETRLILGVDNDVIVIRKPRQTKLIGGERETINETIVAAARSSLIGRTSLSAVVQHSRS